MARGRVYWITGLSNSGKTTIGTALYYDLKKNNDNVVILDGDVLKDITTEIQYEQYSKNGRLARAKRYSSLCKFLSDQGMIVIICTISMFDEVREWNRKNIRGYIEVFLDVSDEIRRSRDKKGLYVKEKDNIQYPKCPDITITNDGSITIRSIISIIRSYTPSNEDDYDRDRVYWNEYYKEINNEMLAPSGFATYVLDYMKSGKHLLEIGCGNGRDSLFFLKNGLRVTAVDASDFAIDKLNYLTRENDNALFICDDFVKCKVLYQMKYDYIYSRFTLHAINEEQENELLQNIKEAVVDEGGLFFVEARTIQDELFGKGVKVAKNAYIYNDHYRRFIDVGEFETKLKALGFQILMLEEKAGLSKTKYSDPVLMRCIAAVNK